MTKLLVVGAVGLALILAGCGSSSPGGSASPPQNLASQAFKYSSCMRDHGVTEFPDPHVSSSGASTKISQVVSSSLAASPHFAAAQKACRGLLPGPGALDPTQLAAQRHAREQDLLAFARCLRGHGLPRFPDPDSQGRLTLEMVQAAGIDLHAPGVLAAGKACVGATHGAVTVADVERAVNGGG